MTLSDRTPTHFELPDLCSPQAVLFLILIAVLLALVLVLFATGLSGFDWVQLGRSAIFILWTMLGSAALLCRLRRRIAGWPLVVGALSSWLIIVLICGLTSSIWQWSLSGLLTDGVNHIRAELLMRDMLLGAVLGGVALRYFYLQAELVAQNKAELTARYEALQARIRPHFLFNSMNIIASLIAVDPDQAELAVEDLANLFRASLRGGEEPHTLGDELELCRRYMRLEQLRLGERLHFEVAIDNDLLSLSVPALSIQPLLENAVYHGVQPRAEGGTVALNLARKADRIEIEIQNPVPLERPAVSGSGMALRNIRERVRMLHPEGGATLETRQDEQGFCARLILPVVLP